jgi:ATP-dependent RNA helicase RhlE
MPFSTFGLHPSLLQGIADLGYQRPTPIQQDAIPPAMAGRDVLACAMTGSGKTAAFLLPILQRLLGEKRGVTRVLVLSPTRELAAQIEEDFRDLAKHTPLRSAAVFGGVAMGPQKRAFESGVDLLVATPGRLLDHFQYPYAKLAGLEVLVLDEADRMLDMGFLPDIRRVLQHLPPGPKQTLFFSATLPREIAILAREMLHHPVAVNVERPSAPATGITHTVFPVREDLKTALLVELLRRNEIGSALVFTRTKHRANRVADYLVKHGVPCDRIHGNRSQPQRTLALSRFKEGKDRVLVATDIAARGIDVEGLTHVINLDVPNLPEDYIHRSGRTARAEALGDAFTFVSDGEMQELAAIERAMGKRLSRRTLEGFDYTHKPAEKLEIPIGERIAQIRARKSEERARAQAKAKLKAEREAQRPASAAGQGRGTAPGERSQRPAGPARPANRRGRPAGSPHGRPGERSPVGEPGNRAHSGPPAGYQPRGRRPDHPHARPAGAQGRHAGAAPQARYGPNVDWETAPPPSLLPERRPNGVAGRGPVARQDLTRRGGRGNPR